MEEHKMINAQTKLYGLIGNPVQHSLSPIIHNRVFKRMGLNAVYVAFEVNDLRGALKGIKDLGIHGASVTIPFKTKVIPLLDQIEDVANEIQAVNTVKNEGGKLIGYNTDWRGAIEALEEGINLENKRIMLLGAGGAARAIAFGLKNKGCQVFIYNRSLNKSKDLARELGFNSLSSLKGVEPHVIINATSVGMHPHLGESPLPREALRRGMVVMDIVYQPLKTKLLQDAEEKGCRTIDGLEMLSRQAAVQIEIWTKKKPEVKQIKEDLWQVIKEKESHD
jgi:shikimate dehydrogenase